jgi:uncharacterized protein YaaN involved in tellurite resistance
LKSDELLAVKKIKDAFTVKTSEDVLGYGVSVQQKIADFCDGILDGVQAKDVDNEVADILADLAVEIKTFNEIGEPKKGFITNLFGGINKGAKKASDAKNSIGEQIKYQVAVSKKESDRLKIKYENVSKTIDAIAAKLEKSKIQLIKNVTVMDQMYNKNLDYYKELSIYIIAAKEKQKDYQKEVETQRQTASASNSQMEIQKLNEMLDLGDKLERKIDDLIRSRLISIQNAPQIRLVQRGSEQLIYQIQNSILTAIPVWKSQMIISLGISTNRAALGLSRHISDATNQMLTRNSELLKQGTLEIAQDSEKGLVSVDTLRTANENLIETIYGVMDVQKRGKENRVQAEREILRLEEQLKDALKGAENPRQNAE